LQAGPRDRLGGDGKCDPRAAGDHGGAGKVRRQAPSTKYQMPNKRQMTNGKTSNHTGSGLSFCFLSFVCDLVLVIWNLTSDEILLSRTG
jgi:hypothetical protein